eukprot:9042115-Pyramimonas_sp.AAC.1
MPALLLLLFSSSFSCSSSSSPKVSGGLSGTLETPGGPHAVRGPCRCSQPERIRDERTVLGNWELGLGMAVLWRMSWALGSLRWRWRSVRGGPSAPEVPTPSPEPACLPRFIFDGTGARKRPPRALLETLSAPPQYANNMRVAPTRGDARTEKSHSMRRGGHFLATPLGKRYTTRWVY